MPEQLAIIDTLQALSTKFPHARAELRSILELRGIAREYDGAVHKEVTKAVSVRILALYRELLKLKMN